MIGTHRDCLVVSNAGERDTNRLDAACSAPDFFHCFLCANGFHGMRRRYIAADTDTIDRLRY